MQKMQDGKKVGYALVLSSIITGRALELYSHLPIGDMNDYSNLRQSLVTKFLLTAEDNRRKFYKRNQGMKLSPNISVDIVGVNGYR